MNPTDILKAALPWLGAAAAGPGALGAMAVTKIGEVLGLNLRSVEEAAQAVQDATPEQRLALTQANQAFEVRMRELGFSHAEEMGRQDLQGQTLYVQDTDNARKAHGGNDSVFRLAVCILLAFVVTVVVVLWGCFQLLTGGTAFKAVDPAVVGIVSGLIGTLIGALGANAQQVVSYFFGSSAGSKNNGDALRQSLHETLKKLGEPPSRKAEPW